MKTAAVTVLLMSMVLPTMAEPRILSAYSGGGYGYYYNPSGGGYSNGYSGASAPIHRLPRYNVSSFSGTSIGWFNGWGRTQKATSLPAPCGNYSNAPTRCKLTTTAWDPTFVNQRRGW